MGAVALLAEGVDRNWSSIKAGAQGGLSPSSRRAWIEIMLSGGDIDTVIESPSSRRAWIEIRRVWTRATLRIVALLAEGVDRNLPIRKSICNE